MKKILPLCILLIMTVQTLPGQTSVHGRVCVHPDGRFLMYEDGTPFFWLGDTAWQMFHRLTVEESKIYLTDRAMKGFTVIQAVCLAEHGGLSSPNAEGEMAFTDTAFTVPNDRYFDHILRVADMADSLGLVMGILPTWGDKFNLKWGPGPEIFDTEEKAYSYGLYVGNKFKDRDNSYIDKMSVEGVIADSKLEIFPFVLKIDRYTLAMSGIQNLDSSFKYHISVIESPLIFRLGIDLWGDFNNMKFKIGKPKYKSTNVPVFSAAVDKAKLNLAESIRNIFQKGVDEAVRENRRQQEINDYKKNIDYVQAVDQQLDTLSSEEQESLDME